MPPLLLRAFLFLSWSIGLIVGGALVGLRTSKCGSRPIGKEFDMEERDRAQAG